MTAGKPFQRPDVRLARGRSTHVSRRRGRRSSPPRYRCGDRRPARSVTDQSTGRSPPATTFPDSACGPDGQGGETGLSRQGGERKHRQRRNARLVSARRPELRSARQKIPPNRNTRGRSRPGWLPAPPLRRPHWLPRSLPRRRGSRQYPRPGIGSRRPPPRRRLDPETRQARRAARWKKPRAILPPKRAEGWGCSWSYGQCESIHLLTMPRRETCKQVLIRFAGCHAAEMAVNRILLPRRIRHKSLKRRTFRGYGG